ncbi:HAMP domain-containing histidine kinase [Nonomuraea turkmeniaca]|uniref:histidine kinase n=1 Tax=Nonomuraea turkmeniaca TaxID=103838 RepID=A0A5S4FEY1_9ACTN|nr:HAMP domain-containing sensor histidine kinase [Nonomuraea turkmeniaca]TMR17362.1 HAMP domain-containing histidine kinase [Nonomuraea turkmeniaca]
MTLRTRVTVAAGFAVLLAVVAVSVVVYVVERGNLRGKIDDSLRHVTAQPHLFSVQSSDALRDVPLVRDVFKQVVERDGSVVSVFAGRRLPVTGEVLSVARGERAEAFFDVEVDGAPVRVLARSAGDGTVLEVGRSLSEVEQALHQLLLTLAVITVAAVGLATVVGRLVAAAAVAPVQRVAEAADLVARTRDLSHHIAVPGGDDLGRLAASFNTMLDALSESLARQHQLVADASHELRTPLATVRTNVEVLARADELPREDRAMLIRDTVAQIGELTRLVGDLVELARGEGQEEPFALVDLDEVVRRVVEIARRDHPSVELKVESEPALVRGAFGRLTRAVSNLIDNAAKWSPPGAAVEIAVRAGMVIVRDHGPGIDAADLPHVFERFYRSPNARTLPGSGLGLAIVKQVADHHHGTVTATTATGGGALFVLRLPVDSRT